MDNSTFLTVTTAIAATLEVESSHLIIVYWSYGFVQAPTSTHAFVPTEVPVHSALERPGYNSVHAMLLPKVIVTRQPKRCFTTLFRRAFTRCPAFTRTKAIHQDEAIHRGRALLVDLPHRVQQFGGPSPPGLPPTAPTMHYYCKLGPSPQGVFCC
jgi:hypothetical protein